MQPGLWGRARRASLLAVALMLVGCGGNASGGNVSGGDAAAGNPAQGSAADGAAAKETRAELTVLAAASLTDVCEEIKAQYETEHENVTLQFSFGSSGALQTQIEEGAPADVFLSAAMKQMNALNDEGLMDSDSIVELLENKIVLVVPADSDTDLSSFEEVVTDKIRMIGLGEPESVPVGQYSEEVFTNLGLLDQVKTKANYGSDVRTVLSWVETGEVDCGIVYATDAYTTDKVKIVVEAPEGSCGRVIYPAGAVKDSAHADEAAEFVEYLQTEEALALFESYGFSRMQ
ncbi:MAG: molybdate ABC transporter substrate-binding protein [Acetatifactor muris]|nr:molybdate ABC transporter substrate-binding protein [Acetatifactor muris]